jgi:acyl-CoA synthetase (AMP-forming)/AMP-acid ligase II
VVDSCDYAALDLRARQIAVALRCRGVRPGDRVLLAYPAGLEFVRAFWGCLYAGAVAVPGVPPQAGRLQRTVPRLRRIAEDCAPRLLLTSSATAALLPLDDGLELLCSELAEGTAEAWKPLSPDPGELALLQYTSGSTREPRGVMLTHANLLHNLAMLASFHGRHSPMVMVHWLPLFHDMGLIRGMLSPVELGGSCVMLDPMEFVQTPRRWLEALSDFRATVTGAPDFGYALTARKVQPADLAGLDLASLRVAFCSAEPIRPSSLRRFADLLEPCGFRSQALKPSYGLAEATVLVSGELAEMRCATLSREGLGRGQVAAPLEPSDEVETVSCGVALGGQTVLSVDARARPCGPGQVGEIWVQGPSVSPGYWGAPPAESFHGRLADGQGPFLRTGDLGWLDPQGRLYICGRGKDLLIVHGQNLYPQDLEAAVEEAVAALRPGCSAAFESERGPAIACESRQEEGLESLAREIWAAAGERLGLSLREVILLPPGGLPKTASGKVQRGLTRRLHGEGRLPARYGWRAPERPS